MINRHMQNYVTMLKKFFTIIILTMPFCLNAQSFNQHPSFFDNSSSQNQDAIHNNVALLSNGKKVIMTTEFVGDNPDDRGKSLRVGKLDNSDNFLWEKKFPVNRGTRMEKFDNKL